jgi:DegV family protein with EDD domain
MNVHIVTDSTCDLPEDVIVAHNLTVVPCYVNFGTQSYLDGVDLTRAEFYTRLPHSDPPPTTSAPGIAAFVEAYQRCIAAGAEAILSIHISAQLSNVVNVARMAAQAESLAGFPIHVRDAGQLSVGTGLQAWEAARLAASGASLEALVPAVRAIAERIHTFAALDTLEYLRRSGRLTRFQALLGTLLDLKPLLGMHADVISMARVRTRAKAFAHLARTLEGLGPLEHVILVHTHAPTAVAYLRALAPAQLSEARAPRAVDVTPVLGAHLGPGAVGFTCMTAR